MNDTFTRRNGELHCEGRSLRTLADEHGTPLYVYGVNHVLDRHRAFEEALSPVDHRICFAVKSNGNLSLLERLAGAGCGFDIVSGGELARVLEAGGDPGEVVFAGVGKTREEMRAALEAGVFCFNVESRPELRRLEDVAAELGRTAPVALRVNPDVDPRTHDKISTGKKETKFGVPIGRVGSLAREAGGSEHLTFRGLQFHIGSQITDRDPFRNLARVAADLTEDLRGEGLDVETLNLGGGLGIRYRDEDPLTPGDWAEVVLPELPDGVTLIVEPGRYLTGNAGAFVTRVEYVKESVNRNFVVVDGGMNALVRPAMYDAYHEVRPVTPREADPLTADVVGPVCETGDYLGKERTMARPRAGDYLAVMSAGAYGFVMASQYNGFPRPAEVLVDGDHAERVREREDYEALWRGERPTQPV